MANNLQQIGFHYLVPRFQFAARTKLKMFLLRQLKHQGRSVETINYVFCTDDYLLQLNKGYLKHNTYTDIITFELSEKGEPLIADIYISIERVKENSAVFQTSFKHELHRVIFHGALHLCTYKDKSPKESKLMREMENKWLKSYFVPRET